MLRKLSFTLTVAALLLTACSSPATEAPATASPAAPATAAEPSASGDDIRTYSIISDETKASYAVGEIIINQNNQFNLAVGTTNTVSGDIHLNFTHPEQSTVGPITVDISALKSDSKRRDEAIRKDWLESAKYPLATFTPTEIKGLPDEYADGAEITFEIVGDLTIRGATRSTTFSVKATLKDEKLTGTATATVLMTDFNFEAPNIAGILKAENEAKLELKFVALPTS
ncbi:MAG: YceI family protein [Chloroflexi bacterium]|nr:YceI family protein [Chloroflexota bacterium]